MQIYDILTFKIGQHYVCPIEYDDSSDLNESEQMMLAGWLDDQSVMWIEHGLNPTWRYSEDTEFCRCDISGEMSDCVTVTITVLGKKSFHDLMTEYVSRCKKGFAYCVIEISDDLANDYGMHSDLEAISQWLLDNGHDVFPGVKSQTFTFSGDNYQGRTVKTPIVTIR